MKKLLKGTVFGAVLFLSASLFSQVTVTPPTVDLCATTPGYVTIPDISIVETAATDIDSSAVGSNTDTLTLKLSTGFEFNPAMTPGLTINSGTDISGFTVLYQDTDSLALAYTVDTKTSIDDLSLTGLEVSTTADNTSGTLSRNGGDAVFGGAPTLFANLNALEIPAVTNAGTTEAICDGATASGFTLTSDVGGATFSWTTSPTNIDAGFTTSGLGNITGEALSLTSATTDGSLVYTATAYNSGCAGPTQNFTITVNADPSIIDPGLTICHGENTGGSTITSTVAGATYTWTASDNNLNNSYTTSGSNATIPDETLTVDNAGASFGTLTYNVTATNGACVANDNLVITVGEEVNSPLNITTGESDTIVVCERNGVNYTFDNSANVTEILWYLTGSGDANITSATNQNNVVVDYGLQSDTLTLVQGYTGCQDTTRIPVEIFGCNFIGVNDNDDVCEGEILELAIDSLPDITPTFNWFTSGSNAIILGENDESTVSVGTNGSGTVDISFGINYNGGYYQIDKTIDIQTLPSRLDISGPSTILCGEQDIPFTATGGTGPYIWRIFDPSDFVGYDTSTASSTAELDFNNNVSEAYVSVREESGAGCVLEEAGQALNFTGGGGDAYNIEKDEASGMNSSEGSVLMWVRTPNDWTGSYDGSGIIYYGSENGTNGYGENSNAITEFTLAIRENRFVFDISQNADNNSLDLQSDPINENTWYHLAITWNSAGDMRMYVDIASAVDAPQQSAAYGTKHSFNFIERHRFGRGWSDTRRFVGEIDNVSLWTTELSNSQIFQYKNQPAPPQDGLYAYYPFDPEDPLADASGNGLTISPESVSPSYEVADYFDDVQILTVNPFTFSLNIDVEATGPSSQDGTMSFNPGTGSNGLRKYIIAPDVSGFNWSPAGSLPNGFDTFDGDSTATNISTGANITLQVTNSAGCTHSEIETMTGNQALTPGSIEFSTTSAQNYSVCQDSLVPPILETANAAGGDGNYTYSWWRSENGGPFLQIPGEFNTTLNLNAPPNNTAVFTSVKRIVEDGNGSTAETNALTFFRIAQTTLSIDIDTTIFGQVNQEYYCESDALVDLIVNAGGGSGFFLDATDDSQYDYIVDGKGSNPQVDMSTASPGAFREVVYVNYDLVPNRCPNYDTTRFAVIPDVANDFNLESSYTTADVPVNLNPSPNTINPSDFRCIECSGFNPIEKTFADEIIFRPSSYAGNEGNYNIQYTYTVDTVGIACKNVRTKFVSISQGVARFENLSTEVCTTEPITFTVDAGAGNIADSVRAYYRSNPSFGGSPENGQYFVLNAVSTNGGQKLDVTIDPSRITWYYAILADSIPFERVEFFFHASPAGPTQRISKNVYVYNVPRPEIDGLLPEYCVNEDAVQFTLSPVKTSTSYQNNYYSTVTGVGQLFSDTTTSNLPYDGRLEAGNKYNPRKFIGTDSALIDEVITYRYTVTSNNSGLDICVLETDYPIDIKDAPDLSITNLAPGNHYCKNDVKDTLVANPSGGTFLSNITTGLGVYTPADIPVGDHLIRYAFTNASTECSDTLSTIITMDTVPDVSILINDMIFCADDDTLAVHGLVGAGPYLENQDDGHISGNGIINADPNKSIGFFDPELTGITQDYVTIRYDYTDDQGCSNSDSIEVFIRSLPTLGIDAYEEGASSPFILDVCQEIGTVRFIGKNTNTNDIEPREVNPTYAWEVNGITQTGNQDTLDYGIGSFSDDALTVEYFYTDRYGCSSAVTENYFVHATPSVSFQEQSNCLVDPIAFQDNSTVENPGTDGIASWSWNFGDFAVLGGGTSTLENPTYKYNNASFYNVQLKATTDFGCVDSAFRFVEIGADPEVDFSWINDCIGLNANGTYFTNETSPFESLTSRFTTMYWDFGDGDTALYYGRNQKHVSHMYDNPNQTFNIQVIAVSPLGCDDTLSKSITTREYLLLDPDNPHFADFESDLGGWYIDTSSAEAQNNAWDIDNIPAIKEDMATLSNGTRAFYTKSADGVSEIYNNNSQSFVKSGCFDLRGLDKPMIKLDYFADMQGLDGAVIQVSIDTGKTWQNLGSFDGLNGTGLNWYNSALVAAKPGGTSEQGWTNQSEDSDGVDSWLEARHTLNENNYNETTVIRFRIAFASNATGERSGFAFDNIWIGNRSRLMLAEHFYNTFNPNSGIIQNVWDEMANRANPLDMIDIGYATNVQLSGKINRDAVGQKEVDYGYPSTINPYTVLDGNYLREPSQDWIDNSQRAIDNRALIDSPVIITADDDPQFFGTNGDSLSLTFNIRAIDDMFNENVRLKGAIVEPDIKFFPNGTDSMRVRNLMRNIMGKISGYQIPTPMLSGEDTTITLYGDASLVFDLNNLGIVLYLQDEDTEEVLQAQFVGDPAGYYVTSLEDLVSGERYKYILFPNPAISQTNIVFDSELKDDYDVTIVDNLGNIVEVIKMESGSRALNINTQNYASGLYILYISNEEQVLAVEKLVIQK